MRFRRSPSRSSTVAHGADWIVPSVRTSGETYETFERVANEDPSEFDEATDAILYRTR